MKQPVTLARSSPKLIQVVRVTLDTNSIIDLEEDRPGSVAIRTLITLHRQHNIRLCVSAIAASERDRGAGGQPNLEKFKAKLLTADLLDVELLLPPMIWDMTFWDHCVWGEKDDPLQPAITKILFPSFVETLSEDDAIRGRQRRDLCDILSMWCHIRYGGDIFITTDANFHKVSKKPRLVQLGAKNILKPTDAVEFLRTGSDRS